MKYTVNPFTGQFDAVQNLSALTGDLLPTVNKTYDVGSDALRWENGLFGGDVNVDGDLYGGARTIKITTNKIIFDG